MADTVVGNNRQQWQQLDPSLELILLGTSADGSFSISVSEREGTKGDAAAALRVVSSDEESSSASSDDFGFGNSIEEADDEIALSYYSGDPYSSASHSPLNPIEGSQNKIQKYKPNSSQPFSCGFEDTFDAIALSESEMDEIHHAVQPAGGVSHMFGETRFAEAFSCGSLEEQRNRSKKASLLQSAKVHQPEALTVKTLDRGKMVKALDRGKTVVDKPPLNLTPKHNTHNTLAEDHGPIRRELHAAADDDTVSSTRSEAITDHVSNVSFAKLASTIITSQAAKKAVEPMDRIAALLESKGVGRGTMSIREIRESTDLRLFLDDYSVANYWPLLDSLYSNKCLRKLVLFRNRTCDRARVRTHQEIDCLFRVLNRLSSTLSELHLWNFTPDDQPSLARGLAYYTSLQYIQIHLETGAISSSLAKTMTTLPNLISLELEVSSSFPVSILLNSKSLGVLTVVCSDSIAFDFDSNEILELAKKLEDNRSLSVLHLEPSISVDSSFPAMLKALISRNRTLETFQFSCAASAYEEGDAALQLVLDTLRANSHLRVLWNNHYESWAVSSKMRRKVLLALEKNQTIQQFHIFPEAAHYWFKKTNALENNMTTTVVVTPRSSQYS